MATTAAAGDYAKEMTEDAQPIYCPPDSNDLVASGCALLTSEVAKTTIYPIPT
jgi:hypothetical protein